MYFLWYDDNPKKPVSAKIDEAVERYIKHYGRTPNVCMLSELVSLTDFKQPEHAPTLRVLPAKAVPSNYFWVGCEALAA